MNARQGNLRWRLLTTVCAASLLVASAPGNAAQDSDRPTVWVELGGQLEMMQGTDERYAPDFTLANLNKPLNAQSPLTAQKPPHFGFGGEGKISFEPQGSDWVFSAAVRYGRSNGKRSLHQQTSTSFLQKTFLYGQPKFKYPSQLYHGIATATLTRFNHAEAAYSSSHAIVDFKAGRDVGLGLFAKGGTSTFSFGVRIAQLHNHSSVAFKSFPDPAVLTQAANVASPLYHHHSYFATGTFSRNFRGVGPSLSWDATAPLVGNHDAGELTFDWGINVAALFGKQTVTGNHETRSLYFIGRPTMISEVNSVPINRSRTVFVPNAGGTAGISVRYPNAKLTLGYRADFFFGAMDGGVNAHKSETRGFYGPFATVSMGFGG